MQMKKVLISLFLAIVCLFFFASGFISAKFVDFPYFTISKTVDIVNVSLALLNLINILVTIGLAIFISIIIDKKKGNDRAEKDLIIRKIDNVYNIVTELQRDCISGKIQYQEAASSIKRINVSFISIYKTIDKCHFSIENDIKDKIKEETYNLRDLLTNSPRVDEKLVQGSDLPMEVKDGVVHFNRQRISQIEAKFDLLKDLNLELQIIIIKK
jgi:hypothetical protein